MGSRGPRLKLSVGFWRRLFLLSLALVLSTLGGELLVRAFAPQTPARTYYRHDADLGYRLRPGQSAIEESQYYRYSVRTNADALRMDSEVDRAADARRVVAVGDSFTFGWGVEFNQSFVARLDRAVAERMRGGQLLNLGVGGYSTGHVPKILERVAAQLQPCAAIYFLNPNDVRDNLLTDINYRVTSYHRTGTGELELKDERVGSERSRRIKGSAVYGWLNSRSHLFQLLKGGRSQNAEQRPRTDRVELDADEVDLAVRLTERHVERLIGRAERLGIPLLVVWIPDWSDLFESANGEPELHMLRGRLASRLGSRFVDPTSNLREHIVREELELLEFYYPDGLPVGHYTVLGNERFANSVEDSVIQFSLDSCHAGGSSEGFHH